LIRHLAVRLWHVIVKKNATVGIKKAILNIQTNGGEIMGKQNCENCGSYELYKMITSGRVWSYSGEIPCFYCLRNSVLKDNFTQNTERINKWRGNGHDDTLKE